MKYVCLIYSDPAEGPKLSAQEQQRIMERHGEFFNELRQKGIYAGGLPLAEVSSATTVRLRGGKRQLTDGPFAETKEVLGGFYVIECNSLDEAIGYAERIPGVEFGSIEVRPIAFDPLAAAPSST